MAEGVNVGSAHVTVAPDTSGFSRELDVKLEQIKAGLSVEVTPEMKAFAQTLRAKLDAVRESIAIKAELDENNIRLKMRSLAAAAGQDVKFKVTVEESTARAAELRVRSMLDQAYKDNENYNNRVTRAAEQAGRDEIAARNTVVGTRRMLNDAYNEHRLFNERVVADSRRAGFDAGRSFFDNFRANVNGNQGGNLASLFSGALPGGRRAVDPTFLGAVGAAGGTPLVAGALFPFVGALTAATPALLGLAAAAPALSSAFSGITTAASAMTKQQDIFNQAADLSRIAFGTQTTAAQQLQAQLTKTTGSQTSVANSTLAHQSALNSLSAAEARLAQVQASGGPTSTQLASAQTSVANAQDRVAATVNRVTAAQDRLTAVEARAHPTASALASAQASLANAQLAHQSAVNSLTLAQERLTAVQAKGGPTSAALASAQAAVANAQNRVQATANSASAAQAKLGTTGLQLNTAQQDIINSLSVQDTSWATLTEAQRVAAIQLRENNSAYKDLSQSQKTALNALLAEKAAWDALSPSQQQALAGYQNLTKAYNALKDGTTPGALMAIASAERAATAALEPLVPLANAATGAVTQLFDIVANNFGGGFYKQFIADMTGAAPGAILGFGKALGGLAGGFGGLLDTLIKSGVGDQFLKFLDGMTSNFANWSTSDAGRASVMKFVATIERDWPTVVNTIKDFGRVISDLWRAFAADPVVFQAVELLLRFISWAGGTPIGQAIIQLAAFGVVLERVAAALRITAVAQALLTAANINVFGFGATVAAPSAASTAARAAAFYTIPAAVTAAEATVVAEATSMATSTTVAATEAANIPLGTARLAAWVDEAAIPAATIPTVVRQMAAEAALAAGETASMQTFIAEAAATAGLIPADVASIAAFISEASGEAAAIPAATATLAAWVEEAAAEGAAIPTATAALVGSIEAAGLEARVVAGAGSVAAVGGAVAGAGGAAAAGGGAVAGAAAGAGAFTLSAASLGLGAIVLGAAAIYFGNKIHDAANKAAGVVLDSSDRLVAAATVGDIPVSKAYQNLANNLSNALVVPVNSATTNLTQLGNDVKTANIALGKGTGSYSSSSKTYVDAVAQSATDLKAVMFMGKTELGQEAGLFVSSWGGDVAAMANALKKSGKTLNDNIALALSQAFTGLSGDTKSMTTQVMVNTKADYLALQTAIQQYETDKKNHNIANIAQDTQSVMLAQQQYLKDANAGVISTSGKQIKQLGADLSAFMHDSAIDPLSKATQRDIAALGKDVTGAFDSEAAKWGAVFAAAIASGFSAAIAAVQVGNQQLIAGSVAAQNAWSSTSLSHTFGTAAQVHPASGGFITGPGTGTSDSIPAMVSNGEFVVNARATAANLSTLYRMNRMAGGGLVGGTVTPDMAAAIVITDAADQGKILQAAVGDETNTTRQRIADSVVQHKLLSGAFIVGFQNATASNMAVQKQKLLDLQGDYKTNFNTKVANDQVVQRIGTMSLQNDYRANFNNKIANDQTVQRTGVSNLQNDFRTNFNTKVFNDQTVQRTGIASIQSNFATNFNAMGVAATGNVRTNIAAIGAAASSAAAGALTSAQNAITSSAKSLGGSFTFKAAGGLMQGPGTGTSDSIPTMLSNGEFVVNAAATAKMLPLLHKINKMATGGLVSSADVGAGYDIGAGGVFDRMSDQGISVIQIAAINKIVADIKANTMALSGSGLGTMDPGAILKYAAQIGTGHPYIWGGTGPVGYDCSGLTQAAYGHFGINIPRTSQAQYAASTKETKAQALPGDLVFEYFPDPKDPTSPNHVGIFAGPNSMFDAVSPSSGIHYSPLQNVVGFGRFTRAANLIGGNTPVGNQGALSGSAAQAQAYARSQLGRYGWGANEMSPLISLWNQESGWNDNAVNPSSGAYGIPQSLGHGHPYNLGDYVAQVNWGMNYIKNSYGDPAAAWAHEVANNWYDQGGMWPSGTAGFNNSGHAEGVLTGAAVQRVGGAAGVAALNAGTGGGRQVAVIEANLILDGEHIDSRAFAIVEENNNWLVRMLESGSGSGGG